jgi:hypothetical protein
MSSEKLDDEPVEAPAPDGWPRDAAVMLAMLRLRIA